MPNHTNFTGKYTEAERDAFFAALKRWDGNVRKASQMAHVPVGTARYWLKVAKLEELDSETAAIVRRWKGSVDDKIDKTLYAIFDTVNRKMQKASLPDLTKAARELVALKKSLQGKSGAPVNPDEDDPKLELEDKALQAVQAAQRRRDAMAGERPPLGEIEEVAGEQ